MKRLILLICLPLLSTHLWAQNTAINYGNSLPATDALGRSLPDREEVGPAKERYVGIFYWIWHDYNINCIPTIPSEIVGKCPDAAYDFKNPAWPATSSYSWGQPLWGFYKDTDKWVLARNAQMLSDAGVDVIFFDVTNGSETFDTQWEVLCDTYMELRSRGLDTPKISFFLPFYPTEYSRISTMNLYRKLFKPGKYADLFFTGRVSLLFSDTLNAWICLTKKARSLIYREKPKNSLPSDLSRYITM